MQNTSTKYNYAKRTFTEKLFLWEFGTQYLKGNIIFYSEKIKKTVHIKNIFPRITNTLLPPYRN